MSRIIMFSSIGVILFSIAAGTSWYLQFRHQDGDGLTPADDKAGKHAATKHKDPAEPERPLVRAPMMPDASRLTQMASTLQTQQESLKSREQQLGTREKQLDLVHDQIKEEHKKLDSVRKQIETELQIVQEKLDLLDRKTAEAEKERNRASAELKDIKQVTLEIKGTESKNLKQMAGIYDKMDPDSAAQSIQQMVDKGKIDTAVAILAGMRDAKAANLLTSISNQDPSIAMQLVERVKYLRASTDAPK